MFNFNNEFQSNTKGSVFNKNKPYTQGNPHLNIKYTNLHHHDQYQSQFPNVLVDSNSTLHNALDSFLNAERVFIAFEFQKESSYNDKLATMQIASGSKYFVIDMMSGEIDDDAIKNFIMYDKIQKVVYNAEKFLSAVYQRYRQIPKNIFDITTAGMLCGIDKKFQYRQMLIKVLGKNYKIKDPIKVSFKTRPLIPRAIDRSILNAIHLEDLYTFIHKEITTFNRLHIHDEIVGEMLNEELYTKNIEDAWTKVKFYTTKLDVIRRIKKIAEWREYTAKRLNIHKDILMTDSTLLDVSERNPTCYEELCEIKNLNKAILKPNHSKRLLSCITAAQKIILEKTDIESHVDELSSKYIPLADMFKILLRIKAEQYKISPQLIANNHELAIIANSSSPKVKCVEGWRYEIFGKDALDIKKGKLMVVYENENFSIIPKDF